MDDCPVVKRPKGFFDEKGVCEAIYEALMREAGFEE